LLTTEKGKVTIAITQRNEMENLVHEQRQAMNQLQKTSSASLEHTRQAYKWDVDDMHHMRVTTGSLDPFQASGRSIESMQSNNRGMQVDLGSEAEQAWLRERTAVIESNAYSKTGGSSNIPSKPKSHHGEMKIYGHDFRDSLLTSPGIQTVSNQNAKDISKKSPSSDTESVSRNMMSSDDVNFNDRLKYSDEIHRMRSMLRAESEDDRKLKMELAEMKALVEQQERQRFESEAIIREETRLLQVKLEAQRMEATRIQKEQLELLNRRKREEDMHIQNISRIEEQMSDQKRLQDLRNETEELEKQQKRYFEEQLLKERNKDNILPQFIPLPVEEKPEVEDSVDRVESFSPKSDVELMTASHKKQEEEILALQEAQKVHDQKKAQEKEIQRQLDEELREAQIKAEQKLKLENEEKERQQKEIAAKEAADRAAEELATREKEELARRIAQEQEEQQKIENAKKQAEIEKAEKDAAEREALERERVNRENAAAELERQQLELEKQRVIDEQLRLEREAAEAEAEANKKREDDAAALQAARAKVLARRKQKQERDSVESLNSEASLRSSAPEPLVNKQDENMSIIVSH
jgi:hypothetical protein